MSADILPGATLSRVRFVDAAPGGAHVLLRFSDPRAALAVAEDAAAESPPPAAAGELRFLFVPLGAQSADALLPAAERWVGAGALRVKLSPGWLIWTPARAAVIGPPEAREPMLAAVAEFAFYEAELSALERELSADWSKAQADAPLAHEIGGDFQARLAQLEEMTTRTLLRRIRHVRIEPRLLAASNELAPEARGAAGRLREKAGVEGRLETVDGQLETYEYIYELANQRMSEHRHFRVERALEIAIVVLLAVETILVAYEIYVTLQQGGA